MRMKWKRALALLLAIATLTSLCSMTALAGEVVKGNNGKEIYLSWTYYADDDFTQKVASLDAEQTYYARLDYYNNPTDSVANSICAYSLHSAFDSTKITTSIGGVYDGDYVSNTYNVDKNEIILQWASQNGIIDKKKVLQPNGMLAYVEFKTLAAVNETELLDLIHLSASSITGVPTNMSAGDSSLFTIVETPVFTAFAKADVTFYTSDTETDVAKKLTGTFIDANGTSTEVNVTSVTFKGALTEGQDVVTASYEHEGVTYTCDVTITVVEDELRSIAVSTQPTKLAYASGEALDLSGMVVTATYASNETKELSGYTTEPEAGDKLTIAANNEKPVEVSYGGMTAKTDNLTVSAKIVEKPEATGTYIYDGTEQTFAITGGDCDYYTVEGQTSGTNAGSYEATASLNDTTETSWIDGSRDDVPLTWTIAQKEITPTIAGISDQQYTGEQITPEITVTADGVTLTKDVDYTVSYGDNINVGENNGSVTITAVSDGNYTFEPVTKEFNIVRQAGKISIKANNAEYTGEAYDAENNIEVTKTGTGDVTYTYYLDAEANTPTTTEDKSGAASEGAAPKNAGTYYVKASMAASGNYGSAESTVASFTITKKALTVTADNKSITFGDEAPTYTFTAKGYVGDDNDSVVNANFACDYTQGDNAGTYTITVTAAAANYDITCNPGTLTVAKKTLIANELTASETNPTAKEYDGTAALPGVTYQVTINGNAYTVDGTAEFDNKNVGTGKIVTFTPNAFNSTNYEFETDLTMTFKADITAKALTVTGLTAIDRVYDGTTNVTLTEVEGANPNYTVTTQDGTLTVTQKTLSGSDVTINTIPDQTYTGQKIQPEVTVNGYSTADYDVTYENNIRVGTATATVRFKGNYTGTASKTFQITPMALTVSGVAASNKVYDGTTAATITATLQGVADGDSVQLTPPAADFDTKDAGTGKAVTIAAGGSFTISGADAGNYTLTQPTVSGLTADITPAMLTAPGNQTVTIRNNVTTKQTVSLPAVSGVEADGTLIPVSVTVSENSAACFAVAPTYEAGVITYQLADGLDAAHVSETQTVTVTLGFGGNYNTVSYQLTISITDRQPQAELTYTGATVMTYGETLTLRSAGGSGSGAVSYTVREDTGKAEITGDQLKATQAGTVYVMVHKAADADYTEASSSEVAITIRKAVPTGTPAYTKITSAGKTLADAKLTTVGGTFSVPGSVAWELSDTTTVVANRAYTWIFTPGDTTNYESISGEIVLYNFVDTPYFPAIIGDSSKFNFHDVTRFDYFYDAVKWAVDHDITSGTGRFTFSPNAACTRAQTVTFLWRAAGSPRPVSTVNPFTDVHYGDYFYQAVLWAVENGITMGTSATTFSPDATVTRAQVVTFLWRANGQPAAWNSGFTDVSADAYYAKAVAWAVQNGITTGTGFGVFSPDAACTRAQIVTFLYRYLG